MDLALPRHGKSPLARLTQGYGCAAQTSDGMASQPIWASPDRPDTLLAETSHHPSIGRDVC